MRTGQSASSLRADLERLVGRGKVRADPRDLTAYSTDASIYTIRPQAIVIVEKEEDVAKVLAYALKNGVPVTPRSAGTSVSGGAIGPGIVLDFSRFNQILAVNPEEGWVWVQAGVIYSELNRALEKYRLFFPPDPASGDACKLGGMLANNASGARSVKYGSTKDYILEMKVYLADGSKVTVKDYEVGSPELHRLLQEQPRFSELLNLISANTDLIRSRRLSVKKNSSGYNLFDLAEGLQAGRFDLTRLFVGSEGTLGVITEAKLRLRPKPERTVVALIYLNRFEEIGLVARELNALNPSAVELIDAEGLDLIGRGRYGIPQSAQAMLLVEFDEGNLEEKVEELRQVCSRYELSKEVETALEPDRQRDLWKVREAVAPALYRYGGRKKPLPTVEDVVVPTERMTEITALLGRISERYGVRVGIYGHLGDGNIHLRPLLDINDPEDFRRMEELTREVNQTIIEQGGSLSGEHGDGRLRAEFLRALFGEEIYRLFCKVKEILDPAGILNPGVKLGEAPFTVNIDYRKYTLDCATCGKCNPVCPVYDVVRVESEGPRGWFRILTSEECDWEDAASPIKLCLNCKSCRTVCPAGCDIPQLVLERRSHRPEKASGFALGLSLKAMKWPDLFTGLNKVAAATQKFWNTGGGRWLLERLTGDTLGLKMDRRFILPNLARETLRDRYAELVRDKGKVAYFHGCADNLLANGVGDALLNVLRRGGVEVFIPEQRCCGTPLLTYGWREDATRYARFNIDRLLGFEKIITSCASCHLTLKEYPKIFQEDHEYRDKAEQLAARVYDISEFLLEEVDLERLTSSPNGTGRVKVTYHDPCHLRAGGIVKAPREVLRRISGLEFVEMRDADRCCGGAGLFNIRHYDLSKEYFELRKKPAIIESGTEVVATSCPACIIQLNDGMRGAVKIRHIIQLVADACGA